VTLQTPDRCREILGKKRKMLDCNTGVLKMKKSTSKPSKGIFNILSVLNTKGTDVKVNNLYTAQTFLETGCAKLFKPRSSSLDPSAVAYNFIFILRKKDVT
jgi:hypothetical protein